MLPIDRCCCHKMDSGVIALEGGQGKVHLTGTAQDAAASPQTLGSADNYLVDAISSKQLVSASPYDSRIFTDNMFHEALDDPPHKYTGLMRQAAQALAGAGRTVSSAITGSADYRSLGLIRDTQYNYWGIVISSGGCVALQLETGYQTLKASLIAHGGTESARYYESFLLATLRPALDAAGNHIEKSLIGPATMATYFDGMQQLAHGFNWSPTEHQCSMAIAKEVLSGGEFYWTSKVITAVFSFTTPGVPPRVSISTHGDSSFGVYGTDHIMVPAGPGRLTLWSCPEPGYTMRESGSGIVYCFYDESGQRIEVKYTYPNISKGIPDSAAFDEPLITTACGATTANDSIEYGTEVDFSGGFSATGVTINQTYHSQTYFSTARYIQLHLPPNRSVPIRERIYSSHPQPTPETTPKPCNPYNLTMAQWQALSDHCFYFGDRYYLNMTLYYYQGKHQLVTNIQRDTAGQKRLLAISGGSPDAVYIGKIYDETLHETVTQTSNPVGGLYLASGFANGSVVGLWQYKNSVSTGGIQTILYGGSSTGGGSCPDESGVSIFTTGNSLTTTVLKNETTVTGHISMRVVTGLGVKGIADNPSNRERWDFLFDAACEDPTVEHDLPTPISRFGTAKYWRTPINYEWWDGTGPDVDSDRFVGII